jgi:hypothetical protein
MPLDSRPNTWYRASSRRTTCPGGRRHGARLADAATRWFKTHLKSELGRDPKPVSIGPGRAQPQVAAENRALLNDDKNYLVIVGTGHLVGQDSVIDLLKKDGIGATQR